MKLSEEFKDAKITISRTSTNLDFEDYMTIVVKYGDERLELAMELKDFAYAVTGYGRVPCKYRTD